MHMVERLVQQESWTCGPVALQMLLHWWKIERDLSDLIAVVDCREPHGTRRRDLERALSYCGLRPYARTGATMGELAQAVHHAPVIVNYRPWLHLGDRDSHYALAVAVLGHSVLLVDPWPRFRGPYRRLSHGAFETRWLGYHPVAHSRWFLGVHPDVPRPVLDYR